MKRVIRETFRHEQANWPMGVDIVVRVVKHFTPSEFAVVVVEFNKLTKLFTDDN